MIDEDERADPRAFEAVEAADDGDHEHVDRRAEVDRAGSMWPFHQTKRMPPTAATNDANANASVRWSVTL